MNKIYKQVERFKNEMTLLFIQNISPILIG